MTDMTTQFVPPFEDAMAPAVTTDTPSATAATTAAATPVTPAIATTTDMATNMAPDMTARMRQHFEDAIKVQEKSRDALAPTLALAVEVLFIALVEQNAKILACGNGGSAADAQHFVAELVGRFERERLPLAAIALNTDTAILTAVGNDYGYEKIFERQINALGQRGDVLVAISTGGNSANVVCAIQAALERDMQVIALTGKGGGVIGEYLSTPPHVHLCVPSDRTGRIQEVHGMLLHALCDGIDTLLLGDSE
jgi:D-sedoheptulose 7-phosphate isomerase